MDSTANASEMIGDSEEKRNRCLFYFDETEKVAKARFVRNVSLLKYETEKAYKRLQDARRGL